MLMPISPVTLLEAEGVAVEGSVTWGCPLPKLGQGVYVISLHGDPADCEGLAEPILDCDALGTWVKTAPGMKIDGRTPTVDLLAARLAEYWIADETILYIGSTTRPLPCRLGDYYRSKIGRASPHRGGMWLKTLMNLKNLFVHFAPLRDGDLAAIECRLLWAFSDAVSAQSRAKYPKSDRNHPLPFGNLKIDKVDGRPYVIRHSGIRGAAV